MPWWPASHDRHRPDDGPVARLVGADSHPRSIVAMPESHHLAGKKELFVTDIDGEDMILIDRRSNAHFHDEQVEYFRRHGVTPRYRTFLLKTVEQLMDLVATGNGLTMVTEFETERYPRRAPSCGRSGARPSPPSTASCGGRPTPRRWSPSSSQWPRSCSLSSPAVTGTVPETDTGGAPCGIRRRSCGSFSTPGTSPTSTGWSRG